MTSWLKRLKSTGTSMACIHVFHAAGSGRPSMGK
jgi:hypothetical protein